MLANWINPRLLAAVALALLASHAGVYLLGRAHGRAGQLDREVVKVEQRAADLAVATQARVASVRATEASASDALVDIATHYREVTAHDLQQKDRLIADLRAGNVRLREQLAARPGDDLSPAAAPGPGTAGTGGAELHPATGSALYEIARDADTVARRLDACQRALMVQQRTCNES
ncbi:lysis system i-spanin subunit Rz [Chitiniphilus eburneus]|uniref:lysis system i-spanin subunit Rz n=1 Tax=Chitiniphilus eburneus TaxID=2571148 RepID=UPI0035D11B9A